jgi:hypothetical protein
MEIGSPGGAVEPGPGGTARPRNLHVPCRT